jgi:hypothetical protein
VVASVVVALVVVASVVAASVVVASVASLDQSASKMETGLDLDLDLKVDGSVLLHPTLPHSSF